uniref:Uncharacterized protein n=1 Tax=Pseudo-nitzschia delicatissima TaxID=44447 RepID=A0A6T9ZJV4_9STRA|mmetsp:Transcript_3663/g.7630  ORF Transcript_3663/g.7630 Transcript_3663/m.7630 type:complete len:189 (+) Transcript_3663:473-1039(+)
MLHTIPTSLFVVCHYFRIQSHTNPIFANLKKFSKIATPIEVIATAYFYMVFVNSPDGEYDTQEGMTKFILHYIPYMCWQLGLLLMAIQQCWYICLKRMIPAPLKAFVTPEIMYRYCQMLCVLFVIYTWFCWSFIAGSPAWDTTSGIGLHFAKFIMYFWNFCAVLVPAIFAYFESNDGDDFCITFQELQ